MVKDATIGQFSSHTIILKRDEEHVDGIGDGAMLQCCVSSCQVDVGDVVPSPGNLSLGEHGSSKDGPYL